MGEWRADQQMRRMASDSRTRIVLTFACSNSRAVTACTHTVAPQLQMATSLCPSSVATPYLSCHLLREIEAWPHQRAALRKPSGLLRAGSAWLVHSVIVGRDACHVTLHARVRSSVLQYFRTASPRLNGQVWWDTRAVDLLGRSLSCASTHARVCNAANQHFGRSGRTFEGRECHAE